MSTPNDQEFNDDRLGRIEHIVSSLVVAMGDIKGNIAKYEVARHALVVAMGDIKGNIAKYEVARHARLITFDLGVQYLREIERDELARWAQELSHKDKGVEARALRSFRKADLVIEASGREEIVYVVVEVSYTADHRDTERVMRNAEFLRQLTGREAKPVVASVKNDRHVSLQVEQQLVHWHQIDEGWLKAE